MPADALLPAAALLDGDPRRLRHLQVRGHLVSRSGPMLCQPFSYIIGVLEVPVDIDRVP